MTLRPGGGLAWYHVVGWFEPQRGMPMSPTLESLGIDRLSVAERIELAEAIWDSVATEGTDFALTATQEQDLRRRVTAYEADPQAVSSWDDVKARLRAQS